MHSDSQSVNGLLTQCPLRSQEVKGSEMAGERNFETAVTHVGAWVGVLFRSLQVRDTPDSLCRFNRKARGGGRRGRRGGLAFQFCCCFTILHSSRKHVRPSTSSLMLVTGVRLSGYSLRPVSLDGLEQLFLDLLVAVSPALVVCGGQRLQRMHHKATIIPSARAGHQNAISQGGKTTGTAEGADLP